MGERVTLEQRERGPAGLAGPARAICGDGKPRIGKPGSPSERRPAERFDVRLDPAFMDGKAAFAAPFAGGPELERSGGPAATVRNEALPVADGHGQYADREGARVALDQPARGNDSWRTGVDPGSGSFALAFNLPADRREESRLFLTRSPLDARQTD